MDIAIALLLTHGLLLGHVCDLHPRGPGEWIFEEECHARKECEKAEKVLEDEDSEDTDKLRAMATLIHHGKRA